MHDSIRFDVLSAAVMAHHLAVRRLPATHVTGLIHATVSDLHSAKLSSKGISVASVGKATGGDDIVPGRPWGSHMLKIVMPARDGASGVSLHGKLTRRTGLLRFATLEIVVSAALRIRGDRDGMWAEIRQRLPETLKLGMSGMIGKPLKALIDHPGFTDEMAARTPITWVAPPGGSRRNKISFIPETDDGVDVGFSTGTTDVPIGR